MATTPLHLSFLLLCLSFLIKSQAKHVPALYIFGDSLVDSGNNNEQKTLAKADYAPYGIDYVVGTTGRFTNGFTVADYFSESLKLQQLPPFLDHTNIIEPSSAGYNFASASAGILPETGTTAGKNLNLRMQVGFFRRIVSTILKSRFKTPGRMSRHLSRSIFLVSIGSNDYAVNYLVPQFYNSSRMYNPEQFAQLLVNELGNHLQEMYGLGGRKFVVFEVGPIGCLPAIALKRAGPKTPCVEEINDVVSIFNAKLALKINQLSSTLRNSTFVLVKNFNFMHDMVKNPSRYGFKDSRNPCCIVSEVNGACIPDKTPCKDRDGHVFWDAAHPSSAANRIIANEIFNGTSLCTPMNVRKLINAHKLSHFQKSKRIAQP